MILIKCVLRSIPSYSYVMSIFLIPKFLGDDINQYINQYIYIPCSLHVDLKCSVPALSVTNPRLPTVPTQMPACQLRSLLFPSFFSFSNAFLSKKNVRLPLLTLKAADGTVPITVTQENNSHTQTMTTERRG